MPPHAPLLIGLLVIAHAGCVGPADAPSGTLTPGTSVSATPASSAEEPTPVPNGQGVASEGGAFIGWWSSEPTDPPINVLHEWVLHIETPDGEPVEGAEISLNGDMPAHGHGMPTVPRVTADLGKGDYRVEGMQFQMGGYWVIDVEVSAGAHADTIRFGLDL
jgi:hypothetical protein